MDVGAYWQENKRFVVTVGAGVLVFLIGFGIETSLYQGKISSALGAIRRNTTQLKELKFSAQDQKDAEAENASLRAAVERLSVAANFRARPEFVPDPATGSSANHYLRTLTRVREDLLQRANRASMKVESSLGMPELSPTVEREILRYLEALDLVETVSDLAIRARVDSVDKIQVRLDPGYGSRGGVGAIERTKVQMIFTGSSLELQRLLAWSQRPGANGRTLPIDQFEMATAKGRPGQGRLDVTFLVARVKEMGDLGP